MAKKQYQRETAEKIFENVLNSFGSGVQGHQALIRYKKQRQREDETVDMLKTREAEEKQKCLRADLAQLRSQQEQTLETLDTRIDAKMKRRTQAIMNKFYGLLGNRSGSRNIGAHSREAETEIQRASK